MAHIKFKLNIKISKKSSSKQDIKDLTLRISLLSKFPIATWNFQLPIMVAKYKQPPRKSRSPPTRVTPLE